MFPNESQEYRNKRNELLEEEKQLRQRIYEISKLKQALPLGGKLKENYTFSTYKMGEPVTINFSDLFQEGKDTVVIYSFMFPIESANPCSMCTALTDNFNGNAIHLDQHINLYICSKSPIEKMNRLAQSRGWDNLTFISSEKNSYNQDYRAERTESRQVPILNVFTKAENGDIYHYYGTELIFEPFEHGEPRHVDLFWPLWNILDNTPKGRDMAWFPQLAYNKVQLV